MKPLLDKHHWEFCDFSLNAPVLSMPWQNGLIISSLFQRRGKRGWGNDPLVDTQKIVLHPCNIKPKVMNFVKVRMGVFNISKTMPVSRIIDAKTEDTVFVSSW